MECELECQLCGAFTMIVNSYYQWWMFTALRYQLQYILGSWHKILKFTHFHCRRSNSILLLHLWQLVGIVTLERIRIGLPNFIKMYVQLTVAKVTKLGGLSCNPNLFWKVTEVKITIKIKFYLLSECITRMCVFRIRHQSFNNV